MKTKRLTESAMLLALAIVLELISKAFIPEMPFGGQVTLVAMLPVVLISYRYGVKWGFVSGFCSVSYTHLDVYKRQPRSFTQIVPVKLKSK